MRLYKAVTAIFIILNLAFTTIAQEKNLGLGTSAPVYNIVRLKQAIKIDGNWDKRQWKKIKPIEINNFIRKDP